MGKVKQVTGIDVAAPVKAVQQGVSAIGNATGISPALTQVFQPLEKAVVQPVGQGLASLDKAVGKAIPGGWGTVGMAAASMIPGMQPLTMAGLGAINGSGVLRKGGSFNLQGAMMGGAMAYGMSSLAQYAQGAVPTDVPTVDSFGNLTTPPPNVAPPTDAISSLNASQGWTGAGASAPSAIPTSAINAANIANPALLTSADVGALNALSAPMEAGAGIGLQAAPQPSIMSNIMGGNFGYAADQIGSGISNSASGAYDSLANSASNAYDSLANLGEKAITPSTYTNAATSYGENVAKTGEGIKNLLGAGEMTGAQAAKLATANAAAQGLTSPVMAAGATLYGGMGLAALDEQRKYLEESKAANAISQAEYDSALAEINRSAEDARKAVRENPFDTNPDRSYTPSENFYAKYNPDENLYERLTGQHRQYAVGGSIDDESGMDEARGLSQGNMSNGFMGGGVLGYAAGGMPPRFLSGGGDGMSDSIPASINGKQEARLADGEFVIPADVVSHLGNGSSKAGAKQLYSMMDKVRSARTGTKKQGKQINPRKYLAA